MPLNDVDYESRVVGCKPARFAYWAFHDTRVPQNAHVELRVCPQRKEQVIAHSDVGVQYESFQATVTIGKHSAASQMFKKLGYCQSNWPKFCRISFQSKGDVLTEF